MTDGPNITIDAKQLEMIVAKSLGEKTARLGKWQVKPLTGGLEPNHRLMRISGQARTMAGDRAWSLVLKIVNCAEAKDGNPAGYAFWEREALFYQTGMLSNQPGSLIPPRCYQASQNGDEYWLWLEEVKDELGKPWPIAHLPEVARCLGRFNGDYLAGQTLPDAPWLSRHWLRNYVEIASQTIQDLPDLRKLPYFQRAFPNLSNDFLLQAWEQRDEFLRAMESLPQTFCHQDAFSGNLFWRRDSTGQGQVVALDWAYTGIAAVGEELAPLVAMASFGMPPDSMEVNQLFQSCLEGYLTGLAQAGWTADPQMVSFSSLTTIFYRYLFGAVLGEMWSLMRYESNHPMMAAAFGVPKIDMLLDALAAGNASYFETYQQVSQLLKQFV